jgi:glycosyltransferase involved in cell wall biosynthesis
MKKIKVLTLGDHPLSPSGVGTQTKNVIKALIDTGRYRFISLGGAVKHHDYKPTKIDPYGNDWVIQPVDGYGTPDHVRSLLRTERPDVLWFMTDPRFYEWLWSIDSEIRPLIPMVYYHVWDNYPYPKYNQPLYESNDQIVSISKVTHDIVNNVAPSTDNVYIPHAVDSDIFRILPENDVLQFRQEHFKDEENPDRVMFFFNSRNARRKMSGSIVLWFKEFLDIVGHDKACLLMHTDPKDAHGQDLAAIIEDFSLVDGQVLFSTEKVDLRLLSFLYNMVDCTINISDAEGFGLSALESLSCGTPIIANMTGGLQEQVTDGKMEFGVALQPSSKAIIGSQNVPYIYEDRVSKEDFIEALLKIYNMTSSERKELGSMGRQHVMKNYNFEDFNKRWIDLMDGVHEKHGSWENRKNYKSWELSEVV